MATRKTIKASHKKISKKAGEKPEIKKGSQLECSDCGFVVIVDEICGCPTWHEVVCCNEPMAVRECY